MPLKKLYTYVLVAFATAVFVLTGAAFAQKPTIMKECTACHAAEPNVVRGTFIRYSEHFRSILVDVGPRAWIFRYEDTAELKGAESLINVDRGKEISITYTGPEDMALATHISVKQPLHLHETQVVTAQEMREIVQEGAEKSGYVLIDSRPSMAYNAGHIPGARSVPFPVLKLQGERILPNEKSAPVIFYCDGGTSALSPESANLAEGLGYTNVKVFQAGMPAWKKSGGVVVSEPKHIKDMTSDGKPFVLIDLRPEREAMGGFIRGAVAIPTDQLQSSQWMFPQDKTAPIILYRHSGADEDAFKIVRDWGYENTSVLNDGLAGWTRSNGQVFRGRLGVMVGYVKVPPPGQIGEREFRTIVEKQPADKVILDVRDAETAAEGMLKGAVHIPLAELADRLAELPKDKEILIYSSTGSVASLAYATVSKAGHRVRYLDAIVQADKKGYYEITGK